MGLLNFWPNIHRYMISGKMQSHGQLSWLLNTLNIEISENVFYSQTSKDHWIEFEERCGQAERARLSQLQRELSTINH